VPQTLSAGGGIPRAAPLRAPDPIRRGRNTQNCTFVCPGPYPPGAEYPELYLCDSLWIRFGRATCYRCSVIGRGWWHYSRGCPTGCRRRHCARIRHCCWHWCVQLTRDWCAHCSEWRWLLLDRCCCWYGRHWSALWAPHGSHGLAGKHRLLLRWRRRVFLGCTRALHSQSMVLTSVCFLCRASSIAPLAFLTQCCTLSLFRRRLFALACQLCCRLCANSCHCSHTAYNHGIWTSGRVRHCCRHRILARIRYTLDKIIGFLRFLVFCHAV
jgi:hypothetical protein